MIDLKLSFGSETTLALTNEQFEELVRTGKTITDFAPAKDYWIEDEFSRLFLCINQSVEECFFVYEPENDIEKYLKNSYLTNFFPKTGKISLIEDYEESLFTLLLKRQKEPENILAIPKEKFSEVQKIFIDELNEEAVSNLINTGNCKGQISCCSCGEPGCSSQYLWAKEFTGLAEFHICSGALGQIDLFPFKLY